MGERSTTLAITDLNRAKGWQHRGINFSNMCSVFVCEE